MSSERWRRVEEIFEAAVELSPTEGARVLDVACAGDAELRREVEALLRQYREAGDFLDEPLYESKADEALAVLAASEADPMIGRRLGAYQIEREIGRGGMGAVYLAERADNAFRKRVAIKVVKRGMDTDYILRRFRHERQILAALDHPNITRLLDGGATEAGQPYFVMEYIEGEPLYRHADERRLDLRERLHLFQQICSAVEYAHRNQVIHRDIKPTNILVNPAGVPKLFDFGIAKLLNPELYSDTTPQTATAMRMMTVEYASPEQVQGLPVTFLSDVYSLGVLLYELLTGHRPYRFYSRALHEMTRVICEEEPDAPSVVVGRPENLLPYAHVDHEAATIGHLCELRRETPLSLSAKLTGALDNIIMKALRKEPAERYQSAAALCEDVTHYLEGRPVKAPTYIPVSQKQTAAVEKPKTEEMAIAVLPFKLMGTRRGDDTGDDYLGIGLADALITRLSNVRRLIVRPTSSILHYGDSQVDAFTAGEELNVRFLLEGYVQRAGDRIRVSVQLLNAEERTTVWAEAFNENFTDVFSIQDAISTKVAEAIVPRLSDFERGQLAKRGTNNAEAFEAYLRGRHHFHSLTEEGFAKSLHDYYRAIAHDPGYALAYAGIADYYIFLGIYGVLPFAESSAAAKEAAQRAVSLDENLSEGYAALAFATVCHDFDWETAEQHHLRALELNPNSATAHNWYAFMLLQEARYDEALLEINRATRLDPVSPLVAVSLAWCYYHWRRIDEALTVYRKVITSEPLFSYGRIAYSWALRVAGRHEEAIAQASKAVEFAGQGQLYLSGLGAAYAAAGRVEEAREVLERLQRMAGSRYVSPYCMAIVYCELGERERAMQLLEEALEIKDAWTTWLLTDPQMDALRSDPRYKDFIRRTNNPAVARPFNTMPGTLPPA